jgi:hypothetical protein
MVANVCSDRFQSDHRLGSYTVESGTASYTIFLTYMSIRLREVEISK